MKWFHLFAAASVLCVCTAFADEATVQPAPAAKPMSVKTCNKLADDKKLTGNERLDFVKQCHRSKKR